MGRKCGGGKIEQSLRVAQCRRAKLLDVLPSRVGQSLKGQSDERGLIALSAVRHRRKIRRIGLDEQSVIGHEPK